MSVQFTNVPSVDRNLTSDVTERVEESRSQQEQGAAPVTQTRDSFAVNSVNLKQQLSKFDFENVNAFPDPGDSSKCEDFECGVFYDKGKKERA